MMYLHTTLLNEREFASKGRLKPSQARLPKIRRRCPYSGGKAREENHLDPELPFAT